jgi:hypothetical protein
MMQVAGHFAARGVAEISRSGWLKTTSSAENLPSAGTQLRPIAVIKRV